MHKKTAPSFVHYGEPEKIEKSFAFNVDIFINKKRYNLLLTDTKWSDMIALVAEGTASYRGDRVR